MTVSWPWGRLSASNAETHDLLVELLDPRPGERFLDVGTGAGALAARAAARGAEAVGVDVAAEAVAQARENCPDAEFVVGDAAELPFPDASFDVVASSYGVNFAHDHARAAAELGRVARPGARLGLAVMPLDSRAAALWTLVREYRPGGDHPGAWDARLLEPWFEVEVRHRESQPAEHFSAEERWEFMSEQVGWVRDLAEALDPDERERFRRRFLETLAPYQDAPLRSTLVLGRRR